jgi:hypothetical protein
MAASIIGILLGRRLWKQVIGDGVDQIPSESDAAIMNTFAFFEGGHGVNATHLTSVKCVALTPPAYRAYASVWCS